MQCCHAAYEYDSDIGECVFRRPSHVDGLSIILREDTNKKYIYIRVR